MSEQCGLNIGSEMLSLNLHVNGTVLKESLTIIRGITHSIIQQSGNFTQNTAKMKNLIN